MADGMDADELLLGLASMGFEFEDCQLALEAGNNKLESAVEWLMTRKSNPSNDAELETKPDTAKENLVSLSQEPSMSSDDTQPSAHDHLSSRYIVSEEHQKAKDQFMEKERENARMEAKRRKLMEKRARQEVLQQIAEDKERRDRKHGRKQPSPQVAAQTSTTSVTRTSNQPNKNQCLLQIRAPNGLLTREKFLSNAKLEEVLTFICNQNELNSCDYTLLQPFPSKVFSDADMTCSLFDLGLSPTGSLVLKKKETGQPPTLTGHRSTELSAYLHSAQTSNKEAGRPEDDEHNVNATSGRNDNDDYDIEDDDDVGGGGGDDNSNNAGNEFMSALPVSNRNPPPELDRLPDIVDPNVLRIGGRNNVRAREHGHSWGGGVRLGAVEHNPHAIDPVLRAQTPGESAVKRLEMRQHWQHQSQAGPSQDSHEDQPLLHRNVHRLEDLLISHICHRLPGHQHPITSLGMLPHELCDKILGHLMKNKTLVPKAMQAFLSCGLRHIKFDCYPLVTNELLLALRLHRHLIHLSLRACPLITDKALEAVAVLKRLKSLNLSQCGQLTDKCFFYIKELPSLVTLLLDMTKITDKGVCHFLANAACSPDLLHLSFNGTNITDQSFQAMCGLKALKILSIGNTKITSLCTVQHLLLLENLNVSHTSIDDDGLVAVVNHPSLVSLSLLSTNISNDGLHHLRGLKLSTLKLPNRLHITDRGINNIQGLPLVALDLSDYIHVTDTGVNSIANMTRLTQLSLSNTKITDDGMKRLTALTDLEELNLDRTSVTDEGCSVLACFKHLRILGLSSTGISNKLLSNGTLNHCKNLVQLNLSRTRISNKQLNQLVLPSLSQLNLDWTRVTSDCQVLLTGCPSLKALRTKNCTPPSEDSEDSDDEQT
ncbi:uncharacterized protein [Montipora foliosa]|uniref:uncharacterized protein n=1 Tax=Montipora foliosa TaxID=591990 RepID=UPI0035F13B27